MKQKITDKKLKDQRFRKTERAIIRALFSTRKMLGVRVIVKRAKISRSTLNRHHGSVHEIVPDYEEYVLGKYNRLMRGLVRKKGMRVKTIYHQMLIFIIKDRDIFKMVVGRGDGGLIERMMHKIEPKIIEVYRLPKNCEKILAVYEKEIIGVVEGWIREDFKEDEMVVLSDIIYLTETMRARLMPLVK